MFKSFFLLTTATLLLSYYPLSISATITIAGTGERYPSHVDHLVGSRWNEGYEYMARLQHLPSLCPYSTNVRNITIVPPSDGLPVVLLVPSDGCADGTKVQVAKEWIQPKGVVKYLILYETKGPSVSRRRLGEQQQEAVVPVLLPRMNTRLGGSATAGDDDVDRRGENYVSRMGVLHVSEVTGAALLRILNTQSEKDVTYGGTRVLLDGNSQGSVAMRNWLFWFGLGLMCFGCLCSFCISVRLSDEAQHHAPPPTRPERRRLTRLQVEEWFPPYCMSCTTTTTGDDDDNASNASSCEVQECAICLDDFLQGDYMRKLPCFHEFHSDCIGKWLVERHSTCPLCKLDLLPEEEDDDDDEEVSEAPSIVDSADVDDESSVEAPGDDDDEDNNRSFIMRLLTGSWTSARRRRRRVLENVDETPLLEQQAQDNTTTNDNDYDDSTPLLEDQDTHTSMVINQDDDNAPLDALSFSDL